MTRRDTTARGHRPWFLLIALFAVLALVGACGGDDDDTDASDDPPVTDDADSSGADDGDSTDGAESDTSEEDDGEADDASDDAGTTDDGSDAGDDVEAASGEVCDHFESYMQHAFGMIDAALSGEPSELERVANLIRADLMNLQMTVPDEIRDEFRTATESLVDQLDALEDAGYTADASGEIFQADAIPPEAAAAEDVLNTFMADECGLSMSDSTSDT